MTHDYLIKIFIAYLFLKALTFIPLTWAAILFWWNDRTESALIAVKELPTTN